MGQRAPDARWAPITLNTTASSPTLEAATAAAPGAGEPSPAYRWANRDTPANNLLITNPDGFQYRDLGWQRARNDERLPQVQGADVHASSRRYADRWQGQVSYVYSKSEGTVNNTSEGALQAAALLRDPDAGARQRGRRSSTNDRPHEVKAFIGYEIPKIEVSVECHVPAASPADLHALPALHLDPDQLLARPRYYWSASAPAVAVHRSRAAAGGCRRRACSTCASRRCSASAATTGSPCSADFLNVINAGTVTTRNARVPSMSVLLPDGSGDERAGSVRGAEALLAPRQIMLGARWSF